MMRDAAMIYYELDVLAFSTLSYRSLPFDAADVLSAEPPVDSEPFSDAVSFPLQAGVDPQTNSTRKKKKLKPV